MRSRSAHTYTSVLGTVSAAAEYHHKTLGLIFSECLHEIDHAYLVMGIIYEHSKSVGLIHYLTSARHMHISERFLELIHRKSEIIGNSYDCHCIAYIVIARYAETEFIVDESVCIEYGSRKISRGPESELMCIEIGILVGNREAILLASELGKLHKLVRMLVIRIYNSSITLDKQS